MGWHNILLDNLLATFERVIRAFRSIKNFENSLVTFVRRSILVKESNGRNLKMANRGNQGKVCIDFPLFWRQTVHFLIFENRRVRKVH